MGCAQTSQNSSNTIAQLQIERTNSANNITFIIIVFILLAIAVLLITVQLSKEVRKILMAILFLKEELFGSKQII